MGILDDIKARMGFDTADEADPYDDQYEDDDRYVEFDAGVSPARNSRTGALHEAESVKVVGRAYGEGSDIDALENTFNSIPRGPVPAARRGAYSTPSMFAGTPARAGSRAAAQSLRLEDYYISDEERYVPEGDTTPPRTSAPAARGKMVICRPDSYTDVEELVTAVRDENAPAVLVLADTRMEVGKRIMDFAFGLVSGLDGSIERMNSKVFVLLPSGVDLTDDELDLLGEKGVIERA